VDDMGEEQYSDFYNTRFGQEVLKREIELIHKELNGCKMTLSIGCGPAIHEIHLLESNPNMILVGLDRLFEMLAQAQNFSNIVFGDASHMSFKENAFDCAYYITSLEFIDDYEKAIEETARILRSKGMCIFLILNPESRFFKEEYKDENSYIRKNIKHIDIEKMKAFISNYFNVECGYNLGIDGKKVFETEEKEYASLYVIKGIKVSKREDRKFTRISEGVFIS
jgi:ubiquinone/menaquinone biosynthesis C-methylase UbiE